MRFKIFFHVTSEAFGFPDRNSEKKQGERERQRSRDSYFGEVQTHPAFLF